MKHLSRFLVLLIVLMLLTIQQAVSPHELVDHPTQPVQLGAKSAQADFNPDVKKYLVRTPNELYQRRTMTKDTHVPYAVTDWTSLHEGRIVIEHDARKWHRGQTWRRMQ